MSCEWAPNGPALDKSADEFMVTYFREQQQALESGEQTDHPEMSLPRFCGHHGYDEDGAFLPRALPSLARRRRPPSVSRSQCLHERLQ
jgi:hypothetical protein